MPGTVAESEAASQAVVPPSPPAYHPPPAYQPQRQPVDFRDLMGPITFRRIVVALVGLLVILLVLANSPVFGILLLAGVGGWLYYRYQQQQKRLAAEAAEQAAEAAEQAAFEREVEEGLRAWREDPPPEGLYTVTLRSVRSADFEWLLAGLANLGENPALDLPDEEVLVERVEHIGPQEIVSGVAEEYAVRLKKAIEQTGARVKIVVPSMTTPRPRSPALSIRM